MRWWVRLWILGLLVSGPLAPTAAQDAPAVAHAPIFLDGNADLCDDRSGASDDGIVNCATADGTRARPYVIQGWSISVPEDPGCARTQSSCTPSPRCSESRHAGIAICNVTKHVLVKDVTIDVAARDARTSGLSLNRTTHVVLENVVVQTRALAVDVGLSGTSQGPDRIVIRGLTASTEREPEDLLNNVPLVWIYNSNVTLDASTIDAPGRSNAVAVDTRADHDNRVGRTFVMQGALVQNAQVWGLESRGAGLDVSFTRFLNNGRPGTAPTAFLPLGGSNNVGAFVTGGARVDAQEQPVRMVANVFQGPGPGLRIDEASSAVVQRNHFDIAGGSAETALSLQFCNARLWYNNFNGSGVSAYGAQCSMDARFNWWGQAPAPGREDETPSSAFGEPRTSPQLRVPIQELPTVTIESPLDGSDVYGRVIVRGTARASASNPLTAIQYDRGDGSFQDPMPVEGKERWAFTLNTDAAPLVNFSIWVRGVGAEDAHGIPTRLDLVRVPVPRPPVALIEAQPRAAKPGQAILLDARSSYSPQGTPLLEYLINPGDGRASGWSTEPTLLVEYAKPGLWYASLTVRDGKNVTNTNVAQVLIRIDEGPPGEDGANLLPAPGVLVALGAAAAAVWGGRRW